MNINVGSLNKVKIDAVKESIKEYDFLSSANVNSFEVKSEVHEQPKTLDETIQGAMNRAKNAFKDCDLSFGIEDGLMQVPYTKTGYMNVCACAIYDGKEFHLGLSSAFEYPQQIVDFVLNNNQDISNAFRSLGFSVEKKLGYNEGSVGLLTKGKMLRKEYTMQAITTALIHLENKDLF